MKYILLIFIILLLIPIPIQVSLHYSKEDFYIYFYKINLFSKNGGLLRKFINKKNVKNEPSKEYEAPRTEIKKEKKIKTKKLSFKKFLKKLINNKFKPFLSFSIDMSYSLNDASMTAIFYGILNIFNPLLVSFFSSFFNLKNFALNINPIFNDNLQLDFTLKSIITFNLVQIIYILFLMFKSRIYSEEATPN